ncbi:hypothetical protein ROZALSC1DRAFT_25515 [Rozella allomycis CSF55]|uniref:Pentacotripeptide-repeat region of PRORP domain-containing protein n=1 Tax=Rozella allomycis (strain CSF55) TaxID=988480 RepID=A0A4P9YAT5_ROZAC|nr:hypothetical protein ROZALSC1DRAFT_25515 [Rozella allomycis CSF55]
MYAESSLWDEAYAKLEYMKDNRIDRSVYSYIYLMRALLEANQVEKALELNEKMKQDRIPLNAEGYYYLINGLVKNNLVAKAYHFYISTRKNKIRISSEAFGVLIEAFGEKRDIYMVKQFHHHLTQANRHLNPELVSSLLIAYGNCKNKPCCDSLFKEKEVYLTSPLIVGAKMIADVQTKSYEDVIDMFEKLDEPVNAHLGFNAIESVLISYSKTKNHLKSLELYQRARKVEGQVLRVEAYESLLSCLVENNDEENLFKVIKEMSDSNIQLTCTSFNVLLQVYTNKGLAKEGYALYNRMIESGIKPDRKTYELLFPLYAKLYSSLEDILHLLKEMESNNVKPTTVILVELMKTCMAHGHWSTINNFWKNTVTEALGIKFSYNVAAICYIASSKMPKELPFYQEFRSTVTDKLLLAKRDEAEAVVDILGKNGEFHLIYQFLSIINSVYDTAFDLAIMYLKKGNEKALLVKLDQLYWKKKSSISKNDIK